MSGLPRGTYGQRCHLYFWDGLWWVSRNGPEQWRRGVTLNDNPCADFLHACVVAEAWWVS